MKKTSKRTSASPKRSPGPRPPRGRPPRAPAPQRRAPAAQALLAFAKLAEREGIRWYVFGAEAVNLYGFPRRTADLDLTIDLGERPPLELVPLLRAAGFEPRFPDEAFIQATRVIPVVHQATKLPIDLVLAGPGLEQHFLEHVRHEQLGSVTIPVISPEHLVVTKIIAGRPKDLEDVRELCAIRALDRAEIESLLRALEEALGESDLLPRFRSAAGA